MNQTSSTLFSKATSPQNSESIKPKVVLFFFKGTKTDKPDTRMMKKKEGIHIHNRKDRKTNPQELLISINLKLYKPNLAQQREPEETSSHRLKQCLMIYLEKRPKPRAYWASSTKTSKIDNTYLIYLNFS